MTKTDDIKDSWLNPIRAAQAACAGNKGLGLVTITVLVHINDAVRWSEPELVKVHPARIDIENCNEDILSALLLLGEVDNT